jgi:hypothetical protein
MNDPQYLNQRGNPFQQEERSLEGALNNRICGVHGSKEHMTDV